jgi:hypothetical protein
VNALLPLRVEPLSLAAPVLVSVNWWEVIITFLFEIPLNPGLLRYGDVAVIDGVAVTYGACTPLTEGAGGEEAVLDRH